MNIHCAWFLRFNFHCMRKLKRVCPFYVCILSNELGWHSEHEFQFSWSLGLVYFVLGKSLSHANEYEIKCY